MLNLLILILQFIQYLELRSLRRADILGLNVCEICLLVVPLLLPLVIVLPGDNLELRDMQAVPLGLVEGVLLRGVVEVAETGGGEVLAEKLNIIVDH